MKKRFLLFCLIFLVILPTVGAKELEDFYFEVGEGNIHATVNMFGINTDVGTDYEDIWSGGDMYTFPTVATVMNVTSDDTDDAVGGTGAWNITIFGLDADYLEINETIQLNGTTPVLTTNSYLRIYLGYVRNAGVQQTNDGDILVGTGAYTGAVPDNVYLHIWEEHAQSLTSIYTIPVNKTGFLMSVFLTSSEDKGIEYELAWRAYGEVFRVQGESFAYRSNVQIVFPVPRSIPQRTDIKILGKVSATTGSLGVGYALVLVNNEDIGLASEDEFTSTPDQTILFAVILGVIGFALFILVVLKKR